MNNNLFSGKGARHFLRTYWQKKPRLQRDALPRLDTAIDRDRLVELACRDDVESRLVMGAARRWQVRHGPFRRRDFAHLPPRGWTLLVNGVENFVPAARALQMRFGFVPYARHDDVMISFAVPGGSVGPHYDSYDVFLVQGRGRRRWRISGQKDLALIDHAPLRILRRFRPQREWVLESGDLLYLPPMHAHHGIALDECITWSVGMRAPGPQQMTARFLEFLHDRLRLEGNYRDPDLATQRHPAAIAPDMLRRITAMTGAIRWNKADVARCLGEYLTEPRSNIVFERGSLPTAAQFARGARVNGVGLSLKTRMLVLGRVIFINGESADADEADIGALRRLADRRSLPPATPLNRGALDLLYQWYRAGYIETGTPQTDQSTL